MTLQEFIHKVELGSANRYLMRTLYLLGTVVLILIYNWRLYHNMNSMEAMDEAQVGRNLAEGRAFSTLFIRELSLHVVEERSEDTHGALPPGPDSDYMMIKGLHPDLANAPLYPCVLALWTKTYHVGFTVLNGISGILPGAISGKLPKWNDDLKNPLWEKSGRPAWAPGDFCIAVLNELLLFVVILQSFFLARRLFDLDVAAWTAVFLGVSTLLWRFAMSGLPTMLMMVMFLGLTWCLVRVQEEVREPKLASWALLAFCAGAGLFLGAGAMTRYSFGCLIVPATIFLLNYGGPRVASMCAVMAVAFLLVCTPWLARNYELCGRPFGTAGYALLDDPGIFPEHQLERGLKPRVLFKVTKMLGRKLVANTRAMVQDDLPKLGGNWAMPFFIVGAMVGFRKPGLNVMVKFIVACLVTLTVAQALGHTQVSADSPEINTENLLVLVTPLVSIFGLSFFFSLLEQTRTAGDSILRFLRYAARVLALVPAACGLVMKPAPVAYPPYSPPAIELVSSWMTDRELIMSDIPWAVAWYGDRQCIWTTLNTQEDFYAINDYIKPVRAIFLTPETLDGHFITQWLRPSEDSWGIFALNTMQYDQSKNTDRPLPLFPPVSFPLHHLFDRFKPDMLFLSDWDRWAINSTTNGVAPQ